jgi:DNA-binding transcriptional LysR family regulator
MLDLAQLRSFVEVAERGTVAAAAASLGYTPPAVSQQIAKLETQLGTALFDRIAGRLRLNAAGADLVPVAYRMLDLAEEAKLISLASAPGRLVIAGIASALSALVVPCLDQLRRIATIGVVEAEDDDALRDLGLGHADIVLTQEHSGAAVERNPRYRYSVLGEDRLRLVVAPWLPPSTRLADLDRSPWLVNGAGTRCEAATRRILEAAGVSPQVVGSIADNRTLLELVAAGHGATIVPEVLLESALPGVTTCDEDLGATRSLLGVTRRGSGATHRQVIDLLAGQWSRARRISS